MKIVSIVGNAFINTVPAIVGDTVKAYDMLDTRQSTVVFEDGTEIGGMCTRLVDLNIATDEVAVSVASEIPSPTVSTVEPTSNTTETAPAIVAKAETKA